MSRTFPELVVGGVLIAPFVTDLAAALALFLLLRPVLARVRFEWLFSAAPVALFSLFVVILALMIVVF